MSFITYWQEELERSLAEFVALATTAPDLDLHFGVIGTALLWPIRAALKEDEGYDALFEICGPPANQIVKAIRTWEDDPKSAVHLLASQVRTNEKLQTALTDLIEHFDAVSKFSQKLAQALASQQGHGDVYSLAGQIKAALVNIGGTVNIQSLTVQISSPPPAGPDISPPPEPQPPPDIEAFVGRRIELASLAKQLEASHQVIICGMAGIGKTVVAAMLAHVWQARQFLPPGPIPQQSPVHLSVEEKKDTPTFSSKIFWHTFYAGQGIHTLIWKLAGFLAWHGQADVWHMLNKIQQAGGQLPPAAALFDYLFQLVRGQDYLFCLDAFQVIEQDPALEEFANRLQTAVKAGEITLIISSRQLPGFTAGAPFLPLEGLNLSDTRRLVKARGLTLSPDLISDLYERTAGNPQLLILAINVLRRAGDPARVISRLAGIVDLERYLIKEIDEGLSETDREVMIGVAVLLGYPGSRYVIEAALDRHRLKRYLASLSDRYLLLVHEEERGDAYSEHILVQAFYYDVPSPGERCTMHHRVGQYYHQDEPDLLKAALHYQRAGYAEQAAALAGQHRWIFMNQGYAPVLRQLLEQFTDQNLPSEQLLKIQVARGDVYAFLGERQLAWKSFRAALTLAERTAASEDAVWEAQACLGLGRLLEYSSPPEALRWLERGLAGVRDSHPEEEAALSVKIGTVQIAMGNYGEALEAVNRGLALLPQGASQVRIGGLINLAIINSYQQNLQEASRVAHQALELARELADYYQMIAIWNNLGIYRMLAGDWPGALEAYQEGLALAQRLGSRNRQIPFMVNLGILYTRQGRFDPAEALLDRGLTLARQAGLHPFEPVCLLHLADLNLRRNQVAAASPLLEQAETLALETETRYQLPEIWRLLALVRLADRQPDPALDYARRSVELTRNLGMGLEEGVSQRILGQVLLATKQVEPARLALEASLALLEEQDPYEVAQTKLVLSEACALQNDNSLSATLLTEAETTLEQLGITRELFSNDNN